MTEFFEDAKFVNKFINCKFNSKLILNIMKEIKDANPDLRIDVFICILDKMSNPSTSYASLSAGLYKYSVELWNDYVYKNYKCNFNLLIGYEEICF
jgi:hypothetical protein